MSGSHLVFLSRSFLFFSFYSVVLCLTLCCSAAANAFLSGSALIFLCVCVSLGKMAVIWCSCVYVVVKDTRKWAETMDCITLLVCVCVCVASVHVCDHPHLHSISQFNGLTPASTCSCLDWNDCISKVHVSWHKRFDVAVTSFLQEELHFVGFRSVYWAQCRIRRRGKLTQCLLSHGSCRQEASHNNSYNWFCSCSDARADNCVPHHRLQTCRVSLQDFSAVIITTVLSISDL